MNSSDEVMMSRALALAEQGRGFVEPNPVVGAVVVRDGRVVGEGYHQAYGGPHAEVHALRAAGNAAAGATLYVTLEPCCHHGKTPPCTNQVIAAGIARVVVAMPDPFSLVSGQGIRQLKEAGISVDLGCMLPQAEEANAPYLKLVRKQIPFVHAKWAMSLDGKIATRCRESKWITGEASRQHSNAFRSLVDAIVVGMGTVLHDDPRLTARPPGARTPTRVVLDSRARLSSETYLVQSAKEVPTLVVTTVRAEPKDLDRLQSAGCESLVVDANEEGRVSIRHLLEEMGRRRWTNVLIEGGGEVLGAFADADAVDAVRIYVGRMVIGGASAPSPLAGHGSASMIDVCRFRLDSPLMLENDLFIRGRRTND